MVCCRVTVVNVLYCNCVYLFAYVHDSKVYTSLGPYFHTNVRSTLGLTDPDRDFRMLSYISTISALLLKTLNHIGVLFFI